MSFGKNYYSLNGWVDGWVEIVESSGREMGVGAGGIEDQ